MVIFYYIYFIKKEVSVKFLRYLLVVLSFYLLFSTPVFVILIPLILAILYSSKIGIRGISNSAEVFHLFTIVIIVLSYFGLIKIIHLSNILPFFQTRFLDMIKCIFIFSSISLVPNLLLLEYKSNYPFFDIGKGYILGCISIITIFFFILAIYGYEYASVLRFPEYMILKRIHFMNYINNIENILVMEWILNVVITLMICGIVLYQNVSRKVYYSILLLLVISISFVFMENYATILFMKYYSWYICIFLLLFSYIKKEKL